MKREVIETADGSSTIYIPDLDENYHSSHGAIQEAEHVFILHGLRKMEELGRDSIAIFEMGFGTGLNAFLTKIRAKIPVHYSSIEAFPVTSEELDSLNFVERLGDCFAADFAQIQGASWNTFVALDDHFHLRKIHAKIQDYSIEESSYDLIYFDAFGPRAQGEMWELEILQKMYNALKTGGMLVTYCARGQFKRDLKSLGFEIEALPGPLGKREMTRAWKY